MNYAEFKQQLEAEMDYCEVLTSVPPCITGNLFKWQQGKERLKVLENIAYAVEGMDAEISLWEYLDDLSDTEDPYFAEGTDRICPCGDPDCNRPWGHPEVDA